MSKIKKIAEFFLLLSIGTMFIQKPPIFAFVKITDLFLFISFCFFAITIFRKETNIFIEKKILIVLSIWFLTCLIGTLTSFIIYKNLPIDVIKSYGRILLCFSMFIEIIILSKDNFKFLTKAKMALLFSIILIPIAYIFSTKYPEYFVYFDRFSGSFDDPNYYVGFQIIPILLILFLITKDKIDKFFKSSLVLIFIATIGTIIWSGSRSGTLAIIVALATMIFFIAKNASIKKATIISLIVILAFPLGYLILPSKSHHNISSRYGQITYVPDTAPSPVLKITGGQDRFKIWKSAFSFISHNPLGYGPVYYEIINITGDGTEHRVSHSFVTETLLTGGIGLFVCLILSIFYLLYFSIKNSYESELNEVHVFVAIFIGLICSGLFLDSITSIWIWAVAALVISYTRFYLPSNNS